MLKGYRRRNSNTDKYIYPIKYLSSKQSEIKIEQQIKGESVEYEEEMYQVCSFFGCGKRLRLEETLAGGLCCKHSK